MQYSELIDFTGIDIIFAHCIINFFYEELNNLEHSFIMTEVTIQ